MTSAKSDLDELLTVEEVAQILRVRTRWVYNAANNGTLPRVKVGAYIRFRREDIEAWIAGRKDAS